LVLPVSAAPSPKHWSVSALADLVSIVVGLIGTYLGAALARYFNLPPFVMVNVDGQHVEVIWAILGAVVFLLVISLLRGRGRRRTW